MKTKKGDKIKPRREDENEGKYSARGTERNVTTEQNVKELY